MKPPDRLQPIVRDVRARLARRRELLDAERLAAGIVPDPARGMRFADALRADGLAIIAECKRRSPSAGALAQDQDWDARSRGYARGGAAALSVLTEEDHFGGALEHLADVRACGLPRLRKDFLLEPSMVDEAFVHGADAVLLLPCILDDRSLEQLATRTRELGLAALVEVHDEDELERALALEPEIVGVNARDLTSFEVDLGTVERLLPQVPPSILRVAESGVRGLPELQRVRCAGADAVLVGEALMRSDDPAADLAAWREVCA